MAGIFGVDDTHTRLMWCNACAKYTEHVQTAPHVFRCKICGHGRYDV